MYQISLEVCMRKMDCDFCFRKSKANTSWMSHLLHTWLNLFKESPSINCCSKTYCHAARVMMGKSRFGALEGCNSWIYYRMACLFLYYLFLFILFFLLKSLKPLAFLPLFIDLCKFCICNAFLIEFSILLFFFFNYIMQDYKDYFTYISIPYFDINTQNILPFHPCLSPSATYMYITVDTCTLTETRSLRWSKRNQIDKKWRVLHDGNFICSVDLIRFMPVLIWIVEFVQ